MSTYGGQSGAVVHNDFKVLNHGYIRYIGHLGSDLAPIESARMSTNKESGVDEKKDDGLRDYLWRMQHTTPFEANELIVEIQCPIFVLRQIDRHRTVKYDELEVRIEVESVDQTMREFTSRNEFSGRYSEMPDLFYIPELARIQRKSATNKQGSAEPLSEHDQQEVQKLLLESTAHARQVYENLIARGVASEIARVALPLNQYTKVRLKASLLNWFKFLDLRLRHDVQLETRVYAQAIGKICKQLWPKAWAVFEEHNLYGARLSRTERQTLHEAILRVDYEKNPVLRKLFDKLADGGDLLE